MNFEILRDMENFSNEMLNNIIRFQDREHPAWDESKSFDERIQNLPLHYLVFSHGDRDPDLFGPTVNHYFPLRSEIIKLSAYCKKISANPSILDLHARNGFTGSLIAREGLFLTGLRDPNSKPNQIQDFYDANCYEMIEQTSDQLPSQVDVVLSDWAPTGVDPTKTILQLRPKLIIYIYTEHLNPDSNERQTGVNDGFGEKLTSDYQLVDQWSVERPTNMFKEIWPDLTGNIDEKRFVRVYSNDTLHCAKLDEETHYTPYDWEKELMIIETALEAKKKILANGFPVETI